MLVNQMFSVSTALIPLHSMNGICSLWSITHQNRIRVSSGGTVFISVRVPPPLSNSKQSYSCTMRLAFLNFPRRKTWWQHELVWVKVSTRQACPPPRDSHEGQATPPPSCVLTCSPDCFVVVVQPLSYVCLFGTPWTAACLAHQMEGYSSKVRAALENFMLNDKALRVWIPKRLWGVSLLTTCGDLATFRESVSLK